MQDPSNENQDPRAVRSREALREALLTLLEEKPLEHITIRDIVARARIGYTTFFRHHPSKEALLEDIATEQITALFNLSLPVLDAQDVRSGAMALLTYVDEHRALWSTLLTGGAANTIREEFLRQARKVAEVRGQSDSWLPPDIGVVLLVSGALELITIWLRQTDPLPIEHIAKIFDCVVVSPVLEANDREPE